MPSKTTPPEWRRAFLRALGRCANVREAARAAGIDHATAYQYRKSNPHFARLWEDALASGRAALAAGRVPEDVALEDARPRTIRSSRSGKTCVMATGAGRWNESVEEAFFTRLAETGNVREAARAIGMSTTALYNRRKIWPAFDKCWDEVVTLATERLALSLLTSANNLLEQQEPPLPEFADMSVDQAIRVAQLYEARLRQNGRFRRYDRKRPPVDVEKVKEEIIEKCERMARAAQK